MKRPLTRQERAVLEFCVLELVQAERGTGDAGAPPGTDPMSSVLGAGR
jgi:hypothetical protein